MSNFQIILTGVFVFFILAGVIVFASYRGSSSSQDLPTITLWGTFDQEVINGFLRSNLVLNERLRITYVRKNPEAFESDFIDALASGKSPDLVIFPHDLILKHQNKLTLIPFSTYTERQFKDTFIEGGEIFLTKDGALGLPYIIDPLVMYWNRSMLQSAGIAEPPHYWDEFFAIAPKFNQKNAAGNFTKTIVALGEVINVNHAEEILSALMFEAGNNITKRTDQGVDVVINARDPSLVTPPAESALRFYTEFSNPVKPVYSWSKALPDSKQAFTAETLATYFGFASELTDIRKKNPNLNFDVTSLPQVRDGKTRTTYGNIYALSIPKNSPHLQAAFAIALKLTTAPLIEELARQMNLPPIRRDSLSNKQTDAFKSVFYDSALMSKAWLQPSPEEARQIFKNMVDSVTSGKLHIGEAISRAREELELLIRNLEI